MAYLNVRERKVEARIAYIGPSGAGKATNVEQLGLRATPRPVAASRTSTDDTGETVSIDWAAPSSTQFRDCSLTVKVVAPCGPLSPERTRAALRDADGVVLVLDASPDAGDANRATAELVRDALASTRKRRVPVVVQVNKTDLPDALDPAVVVEGADVSWPSVGAAALLGQGVVETLERALADVLASLEEHGHDEAPSTVRPNGRGEASRAEGNPLLAALRQVLRDTVSEHVAELEARFAGRIDRSVRDALEELGLGTELPALRRTLAEEGAQVHATLGVLRDEVESGRQATAEVASVVGGIADATTRALSAQRTSLDAIEQRLAALETAAASPARDDGTHHQGLVELAEEAVSRIGRLGADVERASSEAREEAAAVRAVVVTEVARSRDELETKLLSSMEARSRADRDLAAAATIPLRRAIDGLAAEVKGSDTRPRVSELAAELSAVKTQLEALAGLVPVVREIDKAMKREVRDVVVRHLVTVEEALRVAHAETKQTGAATEQGLGGLGAQFTELIEELKKREKKGWFG